MRNAPIATLIALIAVIVGACGSDDGESEGESLTSEEREYLEAAEAAETLRGDAAGEAADALEQSYPVPSRFLEVVRVDGLAAANGRALDAAEEVTPPERFEAEHRDWVRRLRAEGEIIGERQSAIARGDVLGAVLALMELELDFGEGVAQWSEPFCRAMVQNFGGGDDRVCPRGESIPGGEYGQQLRAALLPIATELEPRIAIPPFLTGRLLFSYLEAIQPDAERIVAEVRADVGALDPPGELEADHELLLENFDEIGDVARQITEANEERDIVELERLFAESGSVTRSTNAELSDDARPIVETFFLP